MSENAEASTRPLDIPNIHAVYWARLSEGIYVQDNTTNLRNIDFSENCSREVKKEVEDTARSNCINLRCNPRFWCWV